MACPFFKPLRRLDSGGWNPAPRLPLGDAWGGECTARGAWAPPETVQRELCNCGYARGRCEHFPAAGATDAVRFSMVATNGVAANGAANGGEVERLIYILEKDHAPLEHGGIDCSADPREPLASQARAFVESYRGRRDG